MSENVGEKVNGDRAGEAAGEAPKSEADHLAAARTAVLTAALPMVAFDGWSERTLGSAVEAAGVDAGLARLAFPRGGVDLALAFHADGDRRLAEALAEAGLETMRIREKITFAVRRRIEIAAPWREAVRRAAALFALPLYALDGTRAVWRTSDLIWRGIGDNSTDYNWYSKRATLSAVHSATVLFWLGDQSDGSEATWAFLDRRIEDVMRFEKAKAAMRANPLARAMFWGPSKLLGLVKPPIGGSKVETGTKVGLPG